MTETTLFAEIKANIKAAMLAKDTVKLSVMRNLVSACTNELVSKGRMPQDELTDEEVIAVIRRQVKQRKDSIEQFTAGGRADLAEGEQAELVYLEVFLPQLMSEDDVRTIALAKKAELGISDKKDVGRLMAEIMKDLKGKADGAVVKKVVEESF